MWNFIGEIITPYKTVDDCPRNISEDGPICKLIIYEEYQAGLKGLQVGEKILVLYWLDLLKYTSPEQRSCKSGKEKGVFALRSPKRPNPIGAAVLEIEAITQDTVDVRGLDCVNGTKLLDIKPAMMGELPIRN